jgi:hypothetical protein
MKNHHTPKIQKIINGKPQWLTRWGMTLLFCFFCILFILTALVPFKEVAKINGQISGINKVRPASFDSPSKFIISCKMQSNEETLKIRAHQSVTVRLMTLKGKTSRITGKIKRLYKSDHETMTLIISVVTQDALETGILLSTPANAVHLDIITGETVLFKQLMESVASNFRTAKF